MNINLIGNLESALSNDNVSRRNRPATQQPTGSTASSKTTSPQQSPAYNESTNYQNEPTTSGTPRHQEPQENGADAKVKICLFIFFNFIQKIIVSWLFYNKLPDKIFCPIKHKDS